MTSKKRLDELAGRLDYLEARLNVAFDQIGDRSPASEIERLNLAFFELGRLHAQLDKVINRSEKNSQDLRWESERVNSLLEAAQAGVVDLDNTPLDESIAKQFGSRFDLLYHRFENLYRGHSAEIGRRLEVYEELLDLPKLRGLGPAVDLGSGRGEWIQFLAQRGFDAYGVDVNEEMTSAASERGLTIHHVDVLQHLRSLAHNSISIVSMFHVAEHLEFELLASVIRTTNHVLAGGGALVIETPNPTNLRVGASSFYLDPTHVKPIHPKLLEFLFIEADLTDVTIHFLNPGAESPLEVPEALMGDPDGEQMVALLNEHLLTPFDYVVIGYKG
jgi:O-antigen chain-terminating methyltransferase